MCQCECVKCVSVCEKVAEAAGEVEPVNKRIHHLWKFIFVVCVCFVEDINILAHSITWKYLHAGCVKSKLRRSLIVIL